MKIQEEVRIRNDQNLYIIQIFALHIESPKLMTSLLGLYRPRESMMRSIYPHVRSVGVA